MKSDFIGTSADAFHASVKEMCVKSSSQCLSSCDKGSVLVEECSPFRFRVSMWALVGDESEQRLLSFFHHRQYSAQGIFLRDSNCIEAVA